MIILPCRLRELLTLITAKKTLWLGTLSGDTEEYLVLYYDVPVIPTELVIIQSHNPSQVVEIQFIDTDGETWTLWYGEPERISTCPDEWTHTIELDEVLYRHRGHLG